MTYSHGNTDINRFYMVEYKYKKINGLTTLLKMYDCVEFRNSIFCFPTVALLMALAATNDGEFYK